MRDGAFAFTTFVLIFSFLLTFVGMCFCFYFDSASAGIVQAARVYEVRVIL
jgi:hypothetical protein